MENGKSLAIEYKYALLILLAIPALYAYNPLPLYFLNDDFIHVSLSQHAVWGQRNSIRPVGDFSLYIDYLLWGNNAAGYHFTNLLLHFFDTILVYHLCRLFYQRFNYSGDAKWWSACAALLFWGYAFHSESVLWIIGRTGCLSSFFFLISLVIFLSNNKRWYGVLLSYFSFFLALLTYESVAVLPPALVVLAIAFKDLRSKRNVVLIGGYWLLLLLYAVLRIQWTGELAGSYEGANLIHLNISLLISNYSKLVARSIVSPQAVTQFFLLSLAAFAVLFVSFFFVQVKKLLPVRALLALLLLYLLSYLPCISLGIDTHGVESERYLYLPSIFFCILSVAFFSAWKSRRTAFTIFLLFFFYHQVYLLKSSKAFVVASDISKKTMGIIKENPQAQHFYFKNLPQTNYGVTIFRLGLEEGINWLTKDDLASQKMRIISLNNQPYYHLINRLRIVQSDTDAFIIQQVFHRDVRTQRMDTLKQAIFNPQTDLLIDYTPNSIRVFNPK